MPLSRTAALASDLKLAKAVSMTYINVAGHHPLDLKTLDLRSTTHSAGSGFQALSLI